MKKPNWLLNRTMLAVHRRLLAEHGGAPGFSLPRLALALAWPKTVLAFADGRITLYELATAYGEALLRLRPFDSGNERVAFLAARLFLALNGADLPAAPAEQLAMFRAFSAGRVGRGRYAQWMLMHRVVSRGGTVIGVARDRSGRVLKVGVIRRQPAPTGSRRPPAIVPAPRSAEPMLLD